MARRRVTGSLAALVVLVLSTLAAVGTCSRFAKDHPVSRAVAVDPAGVAVGKFSPGRAGSIRVGMLATLSARGESGKWQGRVNAIEKSPGDISVRAEFPAPLPDDPGRSWLLSVDTSIPPEALKP